MDPLKAQYVKFIEVTDPDTGAEVELEVYKDPESGAMFAIDSTFLEQVRQIIPSRSTLAMICFVREANRK